MRCPRPGRPRLGAALGLLGGIATAGQAAPPASVVPQVGEPGDTLSFVVLGHVRGNASGPNYLLDELIEEVRGLDPDLVFLTGDMIWGDYHRNPADSALVESEWDTIDSAFGSLGVPLYRVPGNHDINDVVTRDIYTRRYGVPPAFVDYGPVRFVLLNSAWVPGDGDTLKAQYIRGLQLDSAQVAFLERTLDPAEAYEDAFVLMHHLLWWNDDDRWWDEVHPLLARGRVRAVFSGDYGPMKFSHTERDGVRYVQSSIEGKVGLGVLRNLESSRLLAQQFDNFLYVRVAGSGVGIDVETIGEFSSGHFTPQRWRAIRQPSPDAAQLSRVRRLWTAINSPRRLLAIGTALFLTFAAGFLVGRLAPRRRAAPPSSIPADPA